MADFDLTQTDAQVQAILNDAQDAQGAGAQTTLTTDYIMLKGTNGRYHKILKDSFTEAVRNVLAGLLVNNDKGTTISQIPAISSGDFGSVTPANLASVLGVVKEKIIDVSNKSSVTFATDSCAFVLWCVRGVSYNVGAVIIENNTVTSLHTGYGTMTVVAEGNNRNATITFPSTAGIGAKLHYWQVAFTR